MNKSNRDISESFRLCILLALSGGLMDAYSYVCRGHVFANAQTGNILLLGINLFDKNIYTAIQYLFPILAFIFGILLSDIIKLHLNLKINIHWAHFAIISEASILFFVGFLPQEYNLLANSLTSFACGIQVESFKKLHGNTIATTMCIGNLRSGTQNLLDYLYTKNKDSIKKVFIYYGIILFFTIGAIIGNEFITLYHEKAIMISSILLIVGSFLIEFIRKNTY